MGAWQRRNELCGNEPSAADRGQYGFGLIEIVVGMTLFAVMALSFAATTGAALKTYQASRARTIADEIATEMVEEARRVAYDDLGTVSGNPPGVLAATQTVARAGFDFTVNTRVTYVDDQIPGGFPTGANYKRLRVTITYPGATNPVANLETLVAPSTQPSLSKAVAKVTVVDYALNVPVLGATVNLTLGPSAPRSDSTDAAGLVVFAALDPNPLTGPTSHYELRTTASGYATLREDTPPASAARVQLSPSQLFTTVLRVFQPCTIRVNLVDGSGNPYAGSATVEVSSSRGRESYTVTGGSKDITSVAGEPVVPSVEYTVGAWTSSGEFSAAVAQIVPASYPTDLVGIFGLALAPATTADLVVTVRDAVTNNPISGAVVQAQDGPLGVILSATANSGGVATLSVPAGASPTYTVVVPAQGIYAGAQTTVSVPGPGATTVMINVPRAS